MGFSKIAISQSRLLSQASSLRLPSGHSGQVLSLSNAACPSMSLPWSIWAAAPLGAAVRHIICGFKLFIYFSSRLFCPLRFQGSPQTRWRECFLVFGNFSLSFYLRLPSGDRSLFLPLSSLYLLYFVLPPFKDNGMPFWVPDVLYQHSEVVMWNLLGVQMLFR